MRTTWNFSTAGQTIFGPGAIDQLGDNVRRRGIKRVLIVTDAPLAEAGHVDRIHGLLNEAGVTVAVSDDSEPEPSIAAAAKVVEAGKQFGPDAVLGLGGGSNLDVAKAAALVLSHGGELPDYLGIGRVPGLTMPVIGVPTTAGTGSEVSHCFVLTDTENEMKVSSLSLWLRPALAVVDPQLTVSCPKRATADSGIDALVHAIEAYTARHYTELEQESGKLMPYDGKSPMGDVLAEKAINLVGRHLITAVNEPENQAAREGMALAATLAGMAFSNCAVALVHAMEYPLGGALHCSHGGGNGLLLPHIMRFNLPQRTAEFTRIAELLGEDTTGLAGPAAAELAVQAVEKLQRAIGIPLTIRDLGGKEEQLPEMAEKAFAVKRLLMLNPREPSYDDVLEIYRSAF